jgi:hypothetical protein
MSAGRIRAARVILLIAGVVNLLPIAPLLDPDLLDTMYQVAPVEPTSEILLRHRALVLGLVGVALIVSVFRSSWRTAALVSAAVANGGYVVLAATGGEVSAAATRVMMIDIAVLVLLAIAALLLWGVPARRPTRATS